MPKRSRYEYITRHAFEPSRSWTNKELLMFHYFNPNGLYSQQQTLTDTLFNLVDRGLAKSGALIAHGGDFNHNRMTELYKMKKPRSIPVQVMIEMWENEIEKGWKFVEECEAKAKPKLRGLNTNNISATAEFG